MPSKNGVTIRNTTGAVVGTEINDADGNNLCSLLCVESLSINFENANRPVTADIRVAMVHTEVAVSETRWMTKNPVTGQFSAIEYIQFQDGVCAWFGPRGVEITNRDGDRAGVVSIRDILDGRTSKFKSPTQEIPTC